MIRTAGLLNSICKKITGFLSILCISVAGSCLIIRIGDVSDEKNQVSDTIKKTLPSSEITTWKKVCQKKDLLQKKMITFWSTTTLNQDSTTIVLPRHMYSGISRIYVHLIQKGKRKTAVIQDIMV